MNFDEYQKRCKKTDLYPMDKVPDGVDEEAYRVWLVEYRTLCLCGETGELANKVKKLRRDFDSTIPMEASEGIVHELGDILWYLSTICDIIDVKLEDVAIKNTDMLLERMKQGKIQGEGDDRTVKMYCRKCGAKTSQGCGGHQRNCP
ncbi:MAG: nucleoside triphosphate pyrophosphohydrolase family protein, partial [Planctomycetota bacterium]